MPRFFLAALAANGYSCRFPNDTMLGAAHFRPRSDAIISADRQALNGRFKNEMRSDVTGI
jgi:hypothetical protein